MHGTLSAAVLTVLAASARALNTIEVQAQNFVDSKTGMRFEVIGVDYQPGGEDGYKPASGIDPLSDKNNCLRDAALMQQLGINTIRSYNLDPNINHDECASIFNMAGIYMIIDVNSPLDGESISRDDPAESYNRDYVNRTFSIIDNFKNYPNTLGFFGANELVNADGNAKKLPPYIRAVQRDMKTYIAQHSDRPIPVGYSAADVLDIRTSQFAYLQCAINGDKNDMSRSDFFGLNSYSWCGQSSFKTAGYDVLARDFADTTSPVFFSEYGCNNVKPRIFQEVGTLYGPQMTVFSGGLVYQWTQESNDYGLVQVNPDGSTKLLGDYNTLQKQYNKLDQKLLQSHNTSATSLTPPPCSKNIITSPAFSTDFDIPKPPKGVDSIMKSGSGGIQGKIVDISDLSVPMTVTDVNGNKLSNLAVKPVQEANTPSGTSSGSSTSSGVAPKMGAEMVYGGLVGLVAVMLGMY